MDLVGAVPLLQWWSAPLAYGVAALVVAVGWWRRTRQLPRAAQVGLVLAALSVGCGAWVVVDVVWRPVADGVGGYVFAWLGVLVLVLLQQLAGGRRPARRGSRWWAGRVVAAVVSLGLASGAAALATNAHFSTYPTLGAALGLGHTVVPLDRVAAARAGAAPSRPPGPLLASWRTPAGLPARGQVTSVDIPSSDPRFTPRPALVYLPPAYLVPGRPLLPVLVLLEGQPGQPADWLTAGRLAETMDRWAATHSGLAPVVVVPDSLGASTANPLCSNAHQGRVATYLQADLPAWVGRTLQVDPDPAHWAVGGLSNGATCALQLLTRDPGRYPSALAMSAEPHPTLGSEAATIATGFGGDAAAYRANDPLALFASRRYDGTAIFFSVGSADREYGPAAVQLEAAARAAGVRTSLRTYPGGHAWTVWATALADELDWLGERLGLTA